MCACKDNKIKAARGLEKVEILSFVRCMSRLLERRSKVIEDHHSDLRRELMSHEGYEEGFVRGRLDAFAEVLELLEGEL